MENSRGILTTLRAFHLDHPEAEWADLKARLLEIAEEVLATPTAWESLGSMSLVYSEAREHLQIASATHAWTVEQAKAVVYARRIMAAAEARAEGDPRALIQLIEELRAGDPITPSRAVGAPDSGVEPSDEAPLFFRDLSEHYLAELVSNVRESTYRVAKSKCVTLAEALGDLDLRTHKRKDFLDLKARLQETRKVSTVNSLVSYLSTVLQWGIANGYLKQAFDKKLKSANGATSERKAFSEEQLETLMAWTAGLKEDSMERWAISLAAITGARIGEINQLRREDFREVGGIWVMDIRDNEGKTLKNKYSNRLVPLIDGALGFDLQAFLRFADSRGDGELFRSNSPRFALKLNKMVRHPLGLGETNPLYSFHSLRHSMASRLKAREVPLSTAQSILGHSSQSITFDLYGGGQQVALARLEAALRMSFDLSVEGE